jgi:tRNA(His) 5'-end guanylyltransferase
LSSDEINNILKAVTQQFNIGMMKLNSVIISLSSYIEECYKCYPYDNSVPLNTKFAILYNDTIFNIELFDRIQQLVEDSADNTVVVKDTNDVSKKE